MDPVLDPVIHPLPRLKICGVLAAEGAYEAEVRGEMRFGALRDRLGIKDAALSKQLKHLEEAGYITRFREYGLTRDKDTVWVMLTAKGKTAFDAHVAALQEIAGASESTAD